MVNAVLNPANIARCRQPFDAVCRTSREPAVNAARHTLATEEQVMSISFWAQNQASRAAATAANDQLFSNTGAVSKLFTAGNPSASAIPSVLSVQDPNSIINGFGQAFLNSAMNSAILAAQEGNNRVKQLTNAALGNNTPPGGDLSSQVTFSGSLGVNFGKDGPAMGGGYRFASGAALQTAFKVAFGAKMSNGEAVDTVSVVGNTMTGSTSGPNAHDVFTLTLHPDSGLYTFQLLAPIDQKTTKGSYNAIFLQSLFQAVSSTGQQMQIPTVEMDVYNDYGSVSSQGNWALLHEGALTYQAAQAAANAASSSSSSSPGTSTGSGSSKTYTPPTDPRTNYGYTTSTSAALGVINSINIFS
jgi:Domain of unknown function (DUF5801)